MSALTEVIGRFFYEHGDTPLGNKAAEELAAIRAENILLKGLLIELDITLKGLPPEKQPQSTEA